MYKRLIVHVLHPIYFPAPSLSNSVIVKMNRYLAYHSNVLFSSHKFPFFAN